LAKGEKHTHSALSFALESHFIATVNTYYKNKQAIFIKLYFDKSALATI
jgi:hypothetical protein